MAFFIKQKQRCSRDMRRSGRPGPVKADLFRGMITWMLLCIMVGLSACRAEGMEMSRTSDSVGNSMAWWQKVNAYEIYVNSFQDSDGDGYGDLNGIRQRLDHLEKLGVGAVWLTPVYQSPMVDNGYDVADYYQINPRYGSMEDMDLLIREADQKGIRIVMDLVFNHTSDQCTWFQESAKSRENEYSDWYIWRDAKPDGSEPNNWRSIFGGSAWTWCEARQQYYLHTFASAQPDLNWENSKVRQALYDVARFWLDKGVGGFRMDAIPYIKKPEDFSDGQPDDQDGMVSVHDMTANTDGILDYLHEFKENVSEGTDIFTVGEANGVSADQLSEWVGENGVFDMIFEFSHVNLEFSGAEVWCKAGDWSLTDLKKALTDSQEATKNNGWYPIFFENHDKPRSIDHYFPEDADPVLAGKALGTVLMTLRGTPFIYQGQELGMRNVEWESIEDYNDLNSRSQYETALAEGYTGEEAMGFVHAFSRDNARTPMQWDGSSQAGFTTGTPWLPVREDYEKVNMEAEQADPGSVLSWYRKLAGFRADTPALIEGSYEELFRDSGEIYAFTREDDSEKYLVAVNFTGHTVTYDQAEAGLDGNAAPELLLTSYEDSKSAPGTLRPYEAQVILTGSGHRDSGETAQDPDPEDAGTQETGSTASAEVPEQERSEKMYTSDSAANEAINRYVSRNPERQIDPGRIETWSTDGGEATQISFDEYCILFDYSEGYPTYILWTEQEKNEKTRDAFIGHSAEWIEAVFDLPEGDTSVRDSLAEEDSRGGFQLTRDNQEYNVRYGTAGKETFKHFFSYLIYISP